MSLILQGSTSGSVTLQEPAVAGTTVLTLPTVSGTIITTGSSGQSIPKAALPTGSVLQVVQTAYTTVDSTTAAGPSSFSSTGCTASITPTSASSKILAMLSMATYHASASMNGGARIMRGSSAAFSGIALDFWASGGSGISGNINIQWLDSPNTTSSTTYTAQFSTWGGGTLEINKDFNSNNNGVTYLTLLEIAA
jgi:hypothetical protein